MPALRPPAPFAHNEARGRAQGYDVRACVRDSSQLHKVAHLVDMGSKGALPACSAQLS